MLVAANRLFFAYQVLVAAPSRTHYRVRERLRSSTWVFVPVRTRFINHTQSSGHSSVQAIQPCQHQEQEGKRDKGKTMRVAVKPIVVRPLDTAQLYARMLPRGYGIVSWLVGKGATKASKLFFLEKLIYIVFRL